MGAGARQNGGGRRREAGAELLGIIQSKAFIWQSIEISV